MRPIICRYSLILGVSIALASPLAALAQQAPVTTSSASVRPGGATASESTTASAKIVSIDRAKRTVLLKLASGRIVDFAAGPEIKNFAQLKAGQVVHVRYMESLSLELKKPGSRVPGTKEHYVETSAPQGAMPAAAAGRRLTVVADVVSVDAKAHEVTLRKADGGRVYLNVQDPAQLKAVKAGDQVEAVYTEAMAITVQAAK